MQSFVIYNHLYVGQTERSELNSGPGSTDFTQTEASAVLGNRKKKEVERQGLPGGLGTS